MSARAGEESRVEGLDAGADDYLVKPFSAAELTARVSAHLQLARLRREAEAALRESREQLGHELEDTKRLQGVSGMLIEDEHGQALYEHILDVAMQIMGAEFGSIQRIDAEHGELRLLAWRNFHPESAAYWQRVSVETGTTCGSALRHGQRVLVPDVRTAEALRGTEGLRHYLLSGIASAQSTPLTTHDGRLIGMISTHWRQPHTPAERDLRLLDILARQAADFFERRRVVEALRDREAWLRGQREALEAALNGAPLEASLGALVRTATEHLGPGTRAAFYLANADGTRLHHVVGMPPAYAEAVDGFLIGPESLACGLATHTGEPVLTPDVMTDPRWGPWRAMAERFDYRGCWSFPVHSTAGKFVGTFAAYARQPREATPRDLALASVLTDTASIIISRHREAEARRQAEEALRDSEEALRRANDELEDRVRGRTAELGDALESLEAEMGRRRDLTHRLATAQEVERRRVSRDLHDSVGQLLASLSLAFKAVEASGDLPPTTAARLGEAQRAADALSKEVHALAVRLRPTSLDDLGLEAALAQLVAEWSARTGVWADFHAAGLGRGRLPPDVETALYRIVQEALTNAARHARAGQVSVAVICPDGVATAVIEDNGVGFDPAAAPAGRGSVREVPSAKPEGFGARIGHGVGPGEFALGWRVPRDVRTRITDRQYASRDLSIRAAD